MSLVVIVSPPATICWWQTAPKTDKCVEGGETKSRVSEVTVTHVPLVCVWAEWRGGVLTIRKQLRTLGSTLLPPNAATSPSCRGIWMASWSSRLRWRWSVKPPAPDTCRNKSATTRSSRQHRFFSICSCYLYCVLSTVVNSSTRMCVRIKSSCLQSKSISIYFRMTPSSRFFPKPRALVGKGIISPMFTASSQNPFFLFLLSC